MIPDRATVPILEIPSIDELYPDDKAGPDFSGERDKAYNAEVTDIIRGALRAQVERGQDAYALTQYPYDEVYPHDTRDLVTLDYALNVIILDAGGAPLLVEDEDSFYVGDEPARAEYRGAEDPEAAAAHTGADDPEATP